MASDPLVCCVCITRDRPQYLAQAIECFRSQTYQNKHLIILDSSEQSLTLSLFNNEDYYHRPQFCASTIGFLRNQANEAARSDALIAHWDDDDWSAPERLASQVAFMQQVQVPVVGYHDLPFYDVTTGKVILYRSGMTHYAVGTSLLYTRQIWEQMRFRDIMIEDATWQHNVGAGRVESESSIKEVTVSSDGELGDLTGYVHIERFPMIVARIHPGNTQAKFGNNYTAADDGLSQKILALGL